MSLIIAQIEENRGYFVADTFISTEDSMVEQTSKISNHGLKIHIIQNTAIAVVGKFTPGVQAIHLFSNELKTSPLPKPTLLLECWKKVVESTAGLSTSDTDFLIMIKNTSDIELYKIAEEKVMPCKRAYIGNSKAYLDFTTRFSKKTDTIYHESLSDKDIRYVNDKNNATIAIAEVGQSQAYSDVKSFSEFGLCVEYDQELGFIYPIAATSSASQEMGQQTHTVLTTTDQPSAVGFYYSGNKTGYLFISADTRSPHKIENVSFDQFKHISKEDFAVNLIGSEIILI